MCRKRSRTGWPAREPTPREGVSIKRGTSVSSSNNEWHDMDHPNVSITKPYIYKWTKQLVQRTVCTILWNVVDVNG